jgi:hypothetical protein
MSDDLRDSASQRLRAQLKLGRLTASYKACFCDRETGNLTEHGARVLRDLGAYSNLYKSPLKVSPISRQTDPMATGAAIGRAEVVRRVWALIRLDPNTHPTMTQKDDE